MESSSVDIENNIFTSSKSDIGYKNAMLKKVDVAIGQKSMTTLSLASRALYLDRGNVVEDFAKISLSAVFFFVSRNYGGQPIKPKLLYEITKWLVLKSH